jgi:transposase
LEGIAETLRAGLNQITTDAPDWLETWVPESWFKRYGRVVDEYRLPKGIKARQDYAEVVGNDGMQVLNAIWADNAPAELRRHPILETLRQTWVN